MAVDPTLKEAIDFAAAQWNSGELPRFGTIYDIATLIAVLNGSGASMTPEQIKMLYESNPDTNAFTDALLAKLTALQPVDADVIELRDPVATASALPVPAQMGDMRECLDTGIFYVYYAPSDSFVGGWEPTGGLTSLADYYKKAEVDLNISTAVNQKSLDDRAYTDTQIASAIAPLASSPVIQPPEIFTYRSATPSTTFTLKQPIRFIMEILVLNADNSLYYLQDTDYEATVGGNTVTIDNPELTDGMRVKVIYAA